MLLLVGCAGPLGSAGLGEGPAAEVSPELIGHRQSIIVVESPPALPSPVDHADARGVVALRQPLGRDALRDLCLAVVDAWQHESLDQLVQLLTSDAGPIEARSRGRGPLIEGWRERLHAHEYRRLAGVNLVRPERIERYAWDDLSVPDAPERPVQMQPDELYLRIPIEVTRAAGERLFGDMMLLLARREDGKYKISAYGEADGR